MIIKALHTHGNDLIRTTTSPWIAAAVALALAHPIIHWTKLCPMHEMTLAENVCRLIEKAHSEQSFSRVETLWLDIGPFAAVDQRALTYCLDIVLRGTVAQGARIECQILPVCAWCAVCQAEVTLGDGAQACPYCANRDLRLSTGTQMRIKALDVL